MTAKGEKLYITGNLYVAAAFLTLGAQFRGFVSNSMGFVAFQFEDPEGTLRSQEQRYVRAQLEPVQARDFVDNFISLREGLKLAKAEQSRP